MLTLYRRHKKNCAHRTDGRKYRRCRCPLWADGFIGRLEIRKAVGTCEWEKGIDTVRDWETAGVLPVMDEKQPTSIEVAKTQFLADAEARKLKDSTIDRHRILFRQLEAFATSQGIRYLKELDTPTLNRFRATWKGNSGLADLKKLERLRSFFQVLSGERIYRAELGRRDP